MRAKGHGRTSRADYNSRIHQATKSLPIVSLLLTILTGALLGAPDQGQSPPEGNALGSLPPGVVGSAVYRDHCAGCHDAADGRAPSRDALGPRTPRAIVDALTSGVMRYQGLPLSGGERRAVAEFLTGRTLRDSPAGSGMGRCGRLPPFSDPSASPAWNGWSPALDNAHFQPARAAGLTAANIPSLKLKWAFGFPDASSAWAQPTIAGGRLFIGSQNGTVYSLDARSGCIAWTFTAHSGVRASVAIGRRTGSEGRVRAGYAAFFADQSGYVYAVNAATGTLLWSRKVDEHPMVRLTGSPVYHAGRLFVPTSSYEEGGRPPGYGCCTFRGSLVALDEREGNLIWQTFTIPQAPRLLRAYADGTGLWGPSGGAIWSAPTIDVRRKAIYVGVGNTYSGAPQSTTDAIVAFDLETGAMRWARQMTPGEYDVFGCAPGEVNCGPKPGPDFDFGASPMLVTLEGGRQLIVAGQKSGVVSALDPDHQGRVVWRYRAGGGSGLGGIEWGVASDGVRAFAPVADIYAPEPGGLHAVDLSTGRRAWWAPPAAPVCGKPSRACSGAQFSAVTAIPGAVFSPSNDGAVRAYSASAGSVLWSFDTNRDFQTVNGVKGRGGSMDGPAPVVAAGMLYVSSGYGTFGLRPGNVLLAFSPD
jgi:polyvinyl alcohol dehydrogenase (cytochrome)